MYKNYWSKILARHLQYLNKSIRLHYIKHSAFRAKWRITTSIIMIIIIILTIIIMIITKITIIL